MLRIISALLVTFVVFAGCRDTLSGPELPLPDPVTNPTPPAADIAPLYIKGPNELVEGSVGNYRAEPLGHPELDHYVWRVLGIGQLAIEADDPTGQNRLIRAQSTRDGSTLLTVRAFTRSGDLLAYGEKIVEIL